MHSHCTLNCTLIYYYTKVSAPKCSLTLRSYPFLSCTHLHSKEILLKCTHIALICKNDISKLHSYLHSHSKNILIALLIAHTEKHPKLTLILHSNIKKI